MRYEEPTWTGEFFGSFGVLIDDGDRVQCYVCGEWFDLLGPHANRAHSLPADEYAGRSG